MTKARAVVFDIGNVLLEWEPQRYFERRIGSARMAALFAQVDLEGMNAAIDAGADFQGSLTARMRRHPDWSTEIAIWKDHWIDMIGPPIQPCVDIFRQLQRSGVPVFALSNFGREPFDWARRKFAFLDDFDQSFISGQLRMVKPDDRIYAELEKQTGFAASDLFFIDDRPENIEAALRRGWQGHVFTGSEALKSALEKAGFLPDADRKVP